MRPLFATAAFLAAVLGLGVPDAAALDPCAGFDFSSTTQCALVAEGNCTGGCEGLRYEAACQSELYASCSGSCMADATASCTGGCNTDCLNDCQANPGSFTCSGSCKGDCKASCEASCASEPDSASCRARCGSYCTAECDAACQGELPAATCEQKCASSCEGSCHASANVSCHMDCQASGYATCESNLEGECQVSCEADGALQCDGHYINAANVQACLTHLSMLGIEVEVEGEASGDASFSCAVGPVGRAARLAWPALVAIGLALVVLRRRRK